MTFNKPAILLSLILALTTSTIFAKEVTKAGQSLQQAYLSHWFSYDSSEPLNLALGEVVDDEFGGHAQVRFLSDDGQVVNGLLAFPKQNNSSPKLALLLHPMGLDHQFWWSEERTKVGQELSSHLRNQGYVVISLDARLHGERSREGFGPRELIKRAHSNEPRLYIDTIIGSVRDYRIALNWAKDKYKPDQTLVLGYSMGAQMSLLLASLESTINSVVAIVPPYVASPTSPVAPRIHVDRIIKAKVLWLAATQDQYSDRNQTQETFDRIASADKSLQWFDSGHRLPPEFLNSVFSFLDSLNLGDSSDDLKNARSH